MKYEAGKVYHVEAVLSTVDRNIQVYVDGKRVGLRMFYAPVVLWSESYSELAYLVHSRL